MRRGLAGLILGLSLVLASISWSSFVLTHTVLDPGRSERLADQLLDNEVLRAALIGRLVASMEAALPAAVPVPRQQLELAANIALDDPRVDALVRDGIVRTHRNALEGIAEPVALDADALGAATRDALVAIRPELATVLPPAPVLTIELPTTGLSWFGRLRSLARRASLLLGLAAATGAISSLLITKNRPAILRRVSAWAFGASVFWLLVGYGVPFLANMVGPASTATASAMIDVFFGAMIRPAVLMGIAAAGLLGLSMVWSAANDRQGAALLQSPTPRPTGPRAVPTPRRGGTSSNIRAPRPVTAEARTDATQMYPTLVDPQSAGPRPTASPQAPQHQPRPTPRWIEGVGYVEDNEPTPPAS